MLSMPYTEILYITFVKQPIFIEWTTSVTGPSPILTPTYCHGLGLHPVSTWWYIHVLLNNASQGGGGTLTAYIHVLWGEHLVCVGIT